MNGGGEPRYIAAAQHMKTIPLRYEKCCSNFSRPQSQFGTQLDKCSP